MCWKIVTCNYLVHLRWHIRCCNYHVRETERRWKAINIHSFDSEAIVCSFCNSICSQHHKLSAISWISIESYPSIVSLIPLKLIGKYLRVSNVSRYRQGSYQNLYLNFTGKGSSWYTILLHCHWNNFGSCIWVAHKWRRIGKPFFILSADPYQYWVVQSVSSNWVCKTDHWYVALSSLDHLLGRSVAVKQIFRPSLVDHTLDFHNVL